MQQLFNEAPGLPQRPDSSSALLGCTLRRASKRALAGTPLQEPCAGHSMRALDCGAQQMRLLMLVSCFQASTSLWKRWRPWYKKNALVEQARLCMRRASALNKSTALYSAQICT